MKREPADVPITVDFRDPDHARHWTDAAMAVRPWREEFFSAFADAIASACCAQACRVVELGSGPGFLADRILTAVDVDYVAVDFSAAMHQLARQRLGRLASRVRFVERNLRDPGWSEGLGRFRFAVTNQAVHELRHRRYAAALHAQVRELLEPGGGYLVCDHFHGEGGMANGELYMTVEGQRAALVSAGFTRVQEVLLKGGLVLHHAS